MMEIIGLALAALSTVASIVGSWYVSSKEVSHRRKGFSIWLCGNPITTIVILGVILNVWSGLPLIFSLANQLYFFYTAFRGWKSNGSLEGVTA